MKYPIKKLIYGGLFIYYIIGNGQFEIGYFKKLSIYLNKYYLLSEVNVVYSLHWEKGMLNSSRMYT